MFIARYFVTVRTFLIHFSICHLTIQALTAHTRNRDEIHKKEKMYHEENYHSVVGTVADLRIQHSVMVHRVFSNRYPDSHDSWCDRHRGYGAVAENHECRHSRRGDCRWCSG